MYYIQTPNSSKPTNVILTHAWLYETRLKSSLYHILTSLVQWIIVQFDTGTTF